MLARRFLPFAGTALVAAALTWAGAHYFYTRKFISAQLQIITADNAWLHSFSPSVTKSERVPEPASGSNTYWLLKVRFDKQAGPVAQRSARARVDLLEDQRFRRAVDLRDKRVVTAFKVSQSLQGRGNHMNLMQIELYDVNGKAMRSPYHPIVLADQWMALDFRPYDDAPIPLGHTETGFDLSRVRYIGIRLRVDQWAHRQTPNFYPAQGEITLAPFGIVPNPRPERESGFLSFLERKEQLPQREIPLTLHETEFFAGINYPWHNYGSDFGKNPWNPDPNAHDGWSTKRKMLDTDFAYFKKHGISVVRVFVFCDLRTGLAYDKDGTLTGFDRFVVKDMEALLLAARRHGIKLIPTLLNFDIADGLSFNGAGEHQEFIVDEKSRKEFLEKAMRPFLISMAEYQDVIYALDLMNEPERARFLTNRENWDKLQAFFLELTKVIHQTLPETRVTIGSANRQLLTEFWSEFPNDVLQFHFYQQLEDEEQVPYDHPAEKLATDKPVIIGEVEGDDPAARLAGAKRNGYAGVLFWSYRATQDGYTVDLEKVKEWSDTQTR